MPGGQDLPVVMVSAYPAFKAAYLSGRTGPEAPVLVKVTGRFEIRPTMEGPAVRSLIVDQVLATTVKGTCFSNPRRN